MQEEPESSGALPLRNSDPFQPATSQTLNGLYDLPLKVAERLSACQSQSPADSVPEPDWTLPPPVLERTEDKPFAGERTGLYLQNLCRSLAAS
ncbi:hypothetical protein DPEC_G00090450 [Dallia pectoralis]|uniref:Uncharacterized protein n=1 Tax=Dallia pectoralis TaxID=75939 RepID=A0ACC2H1P0_DALPE|nr:hypothetical protein DPEC_G00090450 [Dallia pectoralis]